MGKVTFRDSTPDDPMYIEALTRSSRRLDLALASKIEGKSRLEEPVQTTTGTTKLANVKLMTVFLAFISTVLISASASAEAITIVCRDIEGWGFGFEESTNPAIEPDGFAGATFSYTWVAGEPRGKIVTQDSSAAGAAPRTEIALVFPGRKYISFIVFYEHASWHHSFMIETRKMLISQHSTGRGPYTNSAASKSFHANCRFSVK